MTLQKPAEDIKKKYHTLRVQENTTKPHCKKTLTKRRTILYSKSTNEWEILT